MTGVRHHDDGAVDGRDHIPAHGFDPEPVAHGFGGEHGIGDVGEIDYLTIHRRGDRDLRVTNVGHRSSFQDIRILLIGNKYCERFIWL